MCANETIAAHETDLIRRLIESGERNEFFESETDDDKEKLDAAGRLAEELYGRLETSETSVEKEEEVLDALERHSGSWITGIHGGIFLAFVSD